MIAKRSHDLNRLLDKLGPRLRAEPHRKYTFGIAWVEVLPGGRRLESPFSVQSFGQMNCSDMAEVILTYMKGQNMKSS